MAHIQRISPNNAICGTAFEITTHFALFGLVISILRKYFFCCFSQEGPGCNAQIKTCAQNTNGYTLCDIHSQYYQTQPDAWQPDRTETGPLLTLRSEVLSSNQISCWLNNAKFGDDMTASLRHMTGVPVAIVMKDLQNVRAIGLLKQCMSGLWAFRYFPKFSALSQHPLNIKYHVHIWQVS